MDEVRALLTSTPGFVALIVSLISGSLAGVGLATLHRSVLRPFWRASVTSLIVLWLGVLYFVSVMVAVASAGDPVPAFMYAMAVVWGVFASGVLLGSWTVFKLRG